MTDQRFRQHFRLSRKSFQILKNILLEEDLTKSLFPYESLTSYGKSSKNPVSFEKALLITLWYLGNSASMRGVGVIFGIAKSTVHKYVHLICRILTSTTSKVILWPKTHNDLMKTEREFFDQCSIPGVIGVVDGCHIRILCGDLSQQKAYTNRKGYRSMLLQGTCNARKMFTNIMCGYPGSCHDARVFRNSFLGQVILGNPAQLIPRDKRILADSAYPLTSEVLTPYKGIGNLTRRQKNFNVKHSCGRICIEHTFGLLKGRWRKLLCVDADLEFIPYIINSCCVLHNICMANEDELEEWCEENWNENDGPMSFYFSQPQANSEGRRLRNEIASRLPGS